jgi:mRNA-decapping enzyme subunit 2
LDDLCVRFIIHLPKEDLSSVARICFQVEEAQWFYEDFIRPLDPTLPSMSLRSFCLRIFQHCPLLASFSVENHMRAFEEFLQYKTRVPVRGAILLNKAMDSTVLVKGWKKGANWSFPRGKINKDEDDLDCAIREVYEETGFDIREAGLVPKDDEVKYIQISMREQQIRLYVFRNIPLETIFEPKTRKEISKVEWYKLSELPAFRKKSNNQDDAAAASNANKFYMVAPFLVPLKKWVVQQRKKDAARAAANNSQLAVQVPVEDLLTEDDIGAQTEPVAAASNGMPAIETLEGATLELQRLLKVQPPTQGLQMNPSAASNLGKGEALMALLQKKGMEPPAQQPYQQAHQPSNQLPHTPYDLTYSAAPEPHTPHHHHPTQRLPVPNYQQPPRFPIQPNMAHNVPLGYYKQNRVPAQMQPQVYGRNPFMNPGQQPRKEPVLLHPQPLPPQVQQSILVRGILPTPNLPDTTGQGGMPPFGAPKNDSYNPQQHAAKPAQLTGHAMSLLSALKSGPRDNNENRPSGNISQENAALQGNNQQQPHAAPWANLPTTQPSNPIMQYLPHQMAPVALMRRSPRTLNPTEPPIPVSKPAPKPTESHRSALLDMFKMSGPKSPLSKEILMKPRGTQEEAVSARKGQPGSPAYKAPYAADVIASASEINGGPVQVNPEINLPYRAVRILSRPKQAEPGKSQSSPSTEAQMHRLQQRLSPLGTGQREVKNTARSGLPSPRDRAFSHQVEHEAKRSPQLYAAQAASLPYAHSQQSQSPTSTHAVLPPFQQQQQPTGVLQRRKDSNPEQRQKLLSLFAKQQASPTGFAGDDKGKAREPAVFDQARASTPRSRVASLASPGLGEKAPTGSPPSSRRGSQTPITPADRNFLLSYLESVSGAAR